MKNKGFTLIEVLVVVSIIGLLASVVLVGLGGFRQRGRDTRRLADLKSLQNGLELFYTKNNSYPATLPDLISAGLGITKLPKDPVTAVDYTYTNCNSAQNYVLAAKLDAPAGDSVYNDSDANAFNGKACSSNFSCAPGDNYCVSF